MSEIAIYYNGKISLNELALFNHFDIDINGLPNEIFYISNTKSYEVLLNYNNKKFHLGLYANKHDAINVAKISHSFECSCNLLNWAQNYNTIYSDLKYCFNLHFSNINTSFDAFIDMIYDFVIADEFCNCNTMESKILEYKDGYLGSI